MPRYFTTCKKSTFPTLSETTEFVPFFHPYLSTRTSQIGSDVTKAVKIPMMLNEDQEFYEAEEVFNKSPEIIDISDDESDVESLGEITTNESISMTKIEEIIERRKNEDEVRGTIFARRFEEEERRQSEEAHYEAAMKWWRQMKNSMARTEFFLSFDMRYENEKELRIQEDLINNDEDEIMDLEDRLRALEDAVFFNQ